VTRALAITLAAVVALVGGGASPAAADEIARGAIIKIERDEIYVNLGRGRGLVDGAPLRIKRRINLKHPVTRSRSAPPPSPRRASACPARSSAA
jgi:hypothetical protein